MEEVIDTVATILSDGGTTIASCVRFNTIMILLSVHRWGIGQCRYLHHLAKVAEKCSWFTELDGFVQIPEDRRDGLGLLGGTGIWNQRLWICSARQQHVEFIEANEK